MAGPTMQKVSTLVSKDIGNYLVNQQTWGGIIFNVKSYGADGDGIADDTTSILSAISAAPTGSTIFFPTGTYNVSSWVLLSVTKTLRLLSFGATIVGSGTNDFIINDQSLTVEGLTFQNFDRVLQVGNNTVATIFDVINCEFQDCGQPVYVDDLKVSRVNVVGNRFYDCTSYAIRINGTELERVFIDRNVIDGAVSRGIFLGSGSNHTGLKNMIVRGNIIKDITGTAGEDTKGILAFGLNIIIDGNHVENVASSDGLGGDNDGIYVKTKRATITNNQLLNAGRTEGAITLKFDGVETSEYESVVSDNVIRFSGLSVDTTGITVKQPNVVVIGNVIEGATNGVLVGNSGDGTVQYVKISSNIIRECKYAVLVTGDTSYIDIQGNDIINSTSVLATDNVLTISGYGKNYTVEGNRFFNSVLNEASIIVSPDGTGTLTLEDIRILNNEIINAVSCTYGIHLIATGTSYVIQNVDVKGNTITDCTGGLRMRVGAAAGTINKITVFSNTFRTVTTGILLSNTINNIRAMNNEGFNTESSGTATITSAITSIGVAPFATVPGFALAAEDVQVTPTSTLGTATEFWVTIAASNQFNINVDVAPGASVTFAWKYKFDRKLNPI